MAVIPENSQKQKRSGRWLRWAFGLSLAVNLLVRGAVSGAAYRHAVGPGAHGGAGPGARSYGTPYVQALPRSERREIFRALRGSDEGKVMSRTARRALFDRMLTALRADPFDADTVTSILAEQRAASQGVQRIAENAWFERVRLMDARARAAYADRLEDVLRRGSKRHRERNPD